MKLNYKFSVKSFAIAVAMFAFLNFHTKSALGQTATVVSKPDTDFSGENMSVMENDFFKWKLVGTWYNSDGLYVYDTWIDNGFTGEMSLSTIIKSGGGSSVISNINAYGYGIWGAGEHTVDVSCKETTTYSWPVPWVDEGNYSKAHTYIVYINY